MGTPSRMVQGASGKVFRVKLLFKLRQALGFNQVRHLKLTPLLDADDTKGHTLILQCEADGVKIPIQSLSKASEYGFKTKVGETEFEFSHQDQDTLRAIAALNPEMEKPGRFKFDFQPQIIRHLRNKQAVEETVESQSYIIGSETTLKPVLMLDYDPNIGVEIEAGFQASEDEPIVRKKDLNITSDGEFVRIGKTFTPIPTTKSEEAEKVLKQGKINLSVSDIPAFFQRDLVLLKSDFQAVLSDEAAKIQFYEGRTQTRITVDKSDGGWLEFQIDYIGKDYVLPDNLIRHNEGESILVNPYVFVKPDQKEVQKVKAALAPLDAIETPTGYQVRVEQFANLEDFINKIGGITELKAEYQNFLSCLKDFQLNDKFQLSTSIEEFLKKNNFQLRGYQRAGIQWLDWLRSTHLHGMLADDMGLGKTWQSIFAIRMAYEKKKIKENSLVVCPKAVLHQWYCELARLAPNLPCYEYYGPSRDSRVFRHHKGTIFIATYDVVVRDYEELQKVPLLYLILDEATFIKNPKAQRTVAVKMLNSAHRVTLSGTPVENRSEELWSQFDFLMRGHLGKYGTFKRLFASKIADDNVQASEALGKRIKPFLLRRTKDEVAKDLPDKIILDEWCELSDEQKSLYSQLQNRYRPQIEEEIKKRGRKAKFSGSVLAVLTKLRQVCDHPAMITSQFDPIEKRSQKFDLALNKIEDITCSGEQVVLFLQFVEGIMPMFEKSFKNKNISYVRLDGKTPNRPLEIERFQKGGAKVALCSLASMSYGVNLQQASHVIHLGRWWNPAKEDQGTDRVHRIGQNKKVYVYRLMTQGTLEEKIHHMQNRKRKVASDIITAANTEAESWTQEDLLEILKPLE